MTEENSSYYPVDSRMRPVFPEPAFSWRLSAMARHMHICAARGSGSEASANLLAETSFSCSWLLDGQTTGVYVRTNFRKAWSEIDVHHIEMDLLYSKSLWREE